MNLREIWEIMNTQGALYFYILLIFMLIFFHRQMKNSKVKRLMSDERFKGARLFRKGITTPTAVSSHGYLGFVSGAISPPLVVPLKGILGYEIFFDGHSVAKREKSGGKELLFQEISPLMEERLKERTKKIVLVFFMKDNYMVNVTLFNGSLRASSVMSNATREVIKQLLLEIETAEKNL